MRLFAIASNIYFFSSKCTKTNPSWGILKLELKWGGITTIKIYRSLSYESSQDQWWNTQPEAPAAAAAESFAAPAAQSFSAPSFDAAPSFAAAPAAESFAAPSQSFDAGSAAQSFDAAPAAQSFDAAPSQSFAAAPAATESFAAPAAASFSEQSGYNYQLP